MNVGHRLAAVLVWIVALGTAYSQADKANSGHAGTPASKEALVSWLRSHQMVIGFDSAGAVVKVEGRIGGDLFHEGPRPRLTHDLLAGLAMLPKLERLNLCEVTMKDEDLAGVRGFSALKELRLEGTGISGTGLRAFSGSTALAKLDVADEPNIGKGLESISPESLRTLYLGGRDVSDEAIQTVARFQNLQTLAIESPRMTGKGLRSLVPLRSLRSIHVTWYPPNVNDSDIEALREKLPRGVSFLSTYAIPNPLEKEGPGTKEGHRKGDVTDIQREPARKENK